MIDKEMTELAAVALGLETEWMTDNQGYSFLHNYENGCEFDPLHNDGDALRLACDLGLRVFPIARTHSGAACSAVGSATGEQLSEVADASLDTYTTTRRAIVLAAAEIGKKMKK